MLAVPRVMALHPAVPLDGPDVRGQFGRDGTKVLEVPDGGDGRRGQERVKNLALGDGVPGFGDLPRLRSTAAAFVLLRQGPIALAVDAEIRVGIPCS